MMFQNQDVLQIAMRQSAWDFNCSESDFLKSENVIVSSKVGPLAKKYYQEPIACNFITYGHNIVASVKEEYREIVKEYIGKFAFYHCFETPNLHWLDSRMSQKGQKVCFMAEYFLPDMHQMRRLPCDFTCKVMGPGDFEGLYLPEWGNALCEARKSLDILGVGAYEGQKLIGLAGCSADCDGMWQIGVDVLPAFRRQGVASALTSRLAMETLERGRVPFYCCAWSNIASARNAVKSGFRPAWVEMTVKPQRIVEEMNR